MLNWLWSFMVLFGIIYGIFQGRIPEISNATFESVRESVSLCITMLGIMSFWTGLMQVAKASGLLEALTKRLMPFLHFLYPGIPKDDIVFEYIASNMVANFLGLGWAATPAGLKAMKELDRLNEYKERASVEMCTFLIVNISSLELIPVNIIGYRSQYGSVNPASILGMAIVATFISTLTGIIFAKLMERRSKE